MKPHKYVRRRMWDLQRFGFTPDKIWQRATTKPEYAVLCATIPKSGTHLLERAVCLCPGYYRPLVRTIPAANTHLREDACRRLSHAKQGQVFFSHIPHSQTLGEVAHEQRIRMIFMYRDPRDVLLSALSYTKRNRKLPWHKYIMSLPSDHERLLKLLEGDRNQRLTSLGGVIGQFVPWLQSGALCIRFENLIGKQGGGEEDAQRQTLLDILNWLNVPEPERESDKLASRLFSSASPTFNRGQLGRWRQEFDDETKDLFKKFCGEHLISLGYESGQDW